MVVDRDPRPPLREGCAHTQEVGGLRMVGAPHDAFPGVWVGTSRQGES